MDDEEFKKLDAVDKKVALWMISNDPQALEAWVITISDEYARVKTIKIDHEQLYQEIMRKH